MMLSPQLKAMAPMCQPGFAQWAEEYFKDMNAKEDRGQEEKFVPKPYYGGRSSTTKKAEKPAAKAEEKPADTPTEAAPLDEQISFDSLGVSA